VDANVLIDFVQTDIRVLHLVNRHIGPLCVARDVLDEVSRLDEVACLQLGIRIVDGTLDQIAEAGTHRGGLSFQDWVCLILARDNQWVCVTNDKRLRRRCRELGVEVRWGLQLLLDLVTVGAMAGASAVRCAEAIAEVNPTIGRAVIDDFKRRIGPRPA